MRGDLRLLFPATGVARVVRDRKAGRSKSVALKSCMSVMKEIFDFFEGLQVVKE